MPRLMGFDSNPAVRKIADRAKLCRKLRGTEFHQRLVGALETLEPATGYLYIPYIP